MPTLVAATKPVTGIARAGDRFAVATGRGTVGARNVLVAANGYVDKAVPWFRHRLVPFHGYIVATEPLPRERIERILPNARTVIEFTHNIFFMRRSPDGERLLVLEFKTGQPQSSHRRQLALYVDAVRAMMPGTTVEGHLVYATPAPAQRPMTTPRLPFEG